MRACVVEIGWAKWGLGIGISEVEWILGYDRVMLSRKLWISGCKVDVVRV